MNKSLVKLTLENRFLLACIQSKDADELLNKVEDISICHLNWKEFLASALWHSVAPLVYLNMNNIQEHLAVPDSIMDELRSTHYMNTARNIILYEELNSILDVFQENNIDIILLKGSALVKSVYNDIGSRPIGDIDLLVKKEDLYQAKNLMSRFGYFPKKNKSPEWYEEHYHHIEYIHPEKNIPVEIHWHITHQSHPGQIFIDESDIIRNFWRRAQTSKISGREVKVLSPEDLLIHLSHHFIKHRFLSSKGYKEGFISKGALMQLCDIIRVLKYYDEDINWERLQREAKEYRLDKILYSTLHIVKELMGDDFVLQSKFNTFAPESVNFDIINLLLKRIFIKEDYSGVSSLLIQSFGENTIKNGIKKIYRVMFPSPEIIAEKYAVPISSKRIYLYYLRRPIDVLLKHREVISDIPRIKDDALLKRWLYTQDPVSKGNN